MNKKKSAKVGVVKSHSVGLLDALRLNPSNRDGPKLSLVGACINRIDVIPMSVASTITTIYLSNNNIETLDNIGQFSKVRVASFSNNKIRYLQSLDSLSRISSSVEKLSFDGNVVAEMPYYFEYVMGMCPHISRLDGYDISAQERLSNKSISRKISTVFEQLCSNELRLCVVDHWRRLTQCNIEMMTIVMGRFR